MATRDRDQNGPVAFKLISRPNHTIAWFWINTTGLLAAADLSATALPLDLPPGKGIAFTGIGPTWLYCRLVQLARENGTFPWVGTFEPRLCRTVIVWTSNPEVRPVGVLVPGLSDPHDMVLTPGAIHDLRHPPLRHALAVVGPPHSGKSVLVAGFQRLLRPVPRAWGYRATPDGEGLWSQEAQEEHAQRIRHKYNWTEQFCQWNLAAVQLLRQTCDLLFVDTGGKMSDDTAALVRLCGEVVILLSKQQSGSFAQWRSFCEEAEADVIAELISDLDIAKSEVREGDGTIKATVAGLDRGNPRPEEQAAPVLSAIARRLNLPDFP